MDGYILPGEHFYDGMPLTFMNPPDLLKRIPEYEFRHDDIVIATYPKAGKSPRLLIETYQLLPKFSYQKIVGLAAITTKKSIFT